MSMRMNVDTVAVLGGKSFPSVAALENEATLIREVSIPAAKPGQLTTRTSDTVGTLTMETGHGITTGARLDLYWTVNGVAGARRGIVVGIVAGLSVPFSLGAGNNLPANLTSITAMIPNEETFPMVGNDMTGLAAWGAGGGQFVFCEDDDTEHLSLIIANVDGGQGYSWFLGGFTNPLAGDTVTKVYFSHGDSGFAHIMRVGALYS